LVFRLTPYEKTDPHSVPVELVRTYPAEAMKAWRLNPLLKGGNGPELLEPLAVVDQAPPMLF
jgi:hypothetical protein